VIHDVNREFIYPIDTTKLDASNKVLRDCKAILNKVTPQTFEKLQKQLEALEIDRYERLEGMINIFFSKVKFLFSSPKILHTIFIVGC
jgi:formate dehydrogenase maturation protein FdhE